MTTKKAKEASPSLATLLENEGLANLEVDNSHLDALLKIDPEKIKEIKDVIAKKGGPSK